MSDLPTKEDYELADAHRNVKFRLSGPPKFPLGNLYVTPGIQSLMVDAVNATALCAFLYRHSQCDWGDLDAEDKATNDEALEHEGRLLSMYRLPSGKEIWAVTEWDRSSTTLLLPSEY